MGCRILVGQEQGTDTESAVMFDSVSGFAFGPLMDSEDEAELFIQHCREDHGKDPRSFSDAELSEIWANFAKQRCEG
jgi:hypothetical protein